MDTALRKLTLVCPARIETALVDCLDGLDPALRGYTILRGEGRGASADLPTTAERVRGAMQVITVQIVLPNERISPLLEAVAVACPRPNLAYWIEPILDFGRLQ